MRRFVLGTGVTIIVLAALGYLFRGPLVMRLMARVVASNLETDLLRELPDGLHVALCGAGSPLPDPTRSGPCTAVIAGDRLYVVDTGAGGSRTLAEMRIPQGAIDGILLTHFHSDHIDGLGEMLLQRWAGGSSTTPTPVYGPVGLERVLEGFALAYSADRQYRIAHHGEQVVPPVGAGGIAHEFAVPVDGERVTLIDDAGLVISAFRVAHEPVEPAVGYRFDYKGRSVVLSGDTTKSANVERFAAGADLLVHEALAPHLLMVITDGARAAGRTNLVKIMEDIPDYHTSPVEAAEVAHAAGVDHLLFNHIVPPLPAAPLEELFVEGVAEAYSGPVTVGRDGTLVTLAAHAASIEVSNLL